MNEKARDTYTVLALHVPGPRWSEIGSGMSRSEARQLKNRWIEMGWNSGHIRICKERAS